MVILFLIRLVIRDSFYKKFAGNNWFFFGAYYFDFYDKFPRSKRYLFVP